MLLSLARPKRLRRMGHLPSVYRGLTTEWPFSRGAFCGTSLPWPSSLRRGAIWCGAGIEVGGGFLRALTLPALFDQGVSEVGHCGRRVRGACGALLSGAGGLRNLFGLPAGDRVPAG